jgi:hypothetical protein
MYDFGAGLSLFAPNSALVAGLEAVVVAAFFLLLGWLIADALFARVLDRMERVSLSFVCLNFFALLLMLLHMISGGRLFASSGVTRAVTLATFAGLVVFRWARSRGSKVDSDDGPLLAPLAVVVGGLLIWSAPVFSLLPIDGVGDTNLHASWTNQLLNGSRVPAGSLTGNIPNFYPWLFHSFEAVVTRLTPGGRVHHALGPMQLIYTAGTILTLFGLGRAITRRVSGGVLAGVLGAITGGVGFVMLRGVDVVSDPRMFGELYLGDLIWRRSYNISFLNMVPAFPRDFAFTLFVSSVLLLVVGLRYRRTSLIVGSGLALGLAGLTGAESFFVGFVVIVVAIVLSRGVPRRRYALTALVPALAVYSLWLVPQLVNFVQLGGYQNLTVVSAVAYSPLAIVVAWGLTTPLAIYGAVRWLPRLRSDIGVTCAAAVVVAAGALVVASTLIPLLLGDAFRTLGRAHRYWPLLHFGVVLFATMGAFDVLGALRRRGKVFPVGAAVLGLLVAITSPLVASLALTQRTDRNRFLEHSVRGDPNSLLNLVAPSAGGDCVVAADEILDSSIYAYTGYRFVMYTTGEVRDINHARLRWRNIYERIGSETVRIRNNTALVYGLGSPTQWRRLANEYEVDIVVMPNWAANHRAVTGLEKAPANDAPVSVVRVDECGA